MTLKTLIPSDDLRPWVDAFWIRSAGQPSAPVTILPDGCADIVLDLRGSAFAVGAMTRPLVLSGPAPEMFGIRFRPGRAAAFLRMPLGAITDDREPLPWWNHVAERAASLTDSSRVEAVEKAMRRHLAEAIADDRVDAAVGILLRSAGTASIEETARSVNVTRQHLARLFETHVGLRPKTFARITRFRRALALGSRMPWADVAATLGYSDQSHLIADFRMLAGTSPVPFFLSSGDEQR